jgi:hypothetical protein
MAFYRAGLCIHLYSDSLCDTGFILAERSEVRQAPCSAAPHVGSERISRNTGESITLLSDSSEPLPWLGGHMCMLGKVFCGRVYGVCYGRTTSGALGIRH